MIKSKGRKRLLYSCSAFQFFHTLSLSLRTFYPLLASISIFEVTLFLTPPSTSFLFHLDTTLRHLHVSCTPLSSASWTSDLSNFWKQNHGDPLCSHVTKFEKIFLSLFFLDLWIVWWCRSPTLCLNILFPCILISSILLKTTSKNVQILNEKERWSWGDITIGRNCRSKLG